MVVNDGHMAELLKLEVAFDIIIEDMEEHMEQGQRDLEESRSDKDAMVLYPFYHSHSPFSIHHSQFSNSVLILSKWLSNSIHQLADFFTAYHTYDEYVAYLTNITTSYSNIAKYPADIPSLLSLFCSPLFLYFLFF